MGLPHKQLFISSLLIGYLTGFSQAVVLSELLVVNGGTQVLNCQLSDTQSTIKGIWYKDEEEIYTAYSTLNNTSSSLRILNAKPSDTGKFSYGLENGEEICKFIVFVGEYVSKLHSVVIKSGTSKHFFCNVSTSLSPDTVTWLKDGVVELESSTQHIVNTSAILQIYAATVTDSGNYTCVQGNQFLGSVYVTVGNVPPKVENLHCYSHYYGDNKCEWSPIPNTETNLPTNYNCTCYKWFDEKTEIGSITNNTCNLDHVHSAATCNVSITSYNILGSVTVSDSVTFNNIRIPYPPTGVTLMQDDDWVLHFNWDYPKGYDEVHRHFLKYKVRYKAVNDGNWKEFENEIVENIQFSFPYRMKPFTKYEAQVKVKQYTKFSSWSESAYCTTNEAKPERQVDATFTTYDKDNTRSITVHWKHLEGKYTNGIILAYYLILQNSAQNVLQAISVAANKTEFTFNGLRKDASYYVNITAANSVDNSTQTILFIKAASYSYDLVIIVVTIIISIIIVASIAFFSWMKLKKANCMMSSYPEPSLYSSMHKLENMR